MSQNATTRTGQRIEIVYEKRKFEVIVMDPDGSKSIVNHKLDVCSFFSEVGLDEQRFWWANWEMEALHAAGRPKWPNHPCSRPADGWEYPGNWWWQWQACSRTDIWILQRTWVKPVSKTVELDVVCSKYSPHSAIGRIILKLFINVKICSLFVKKISYSCSL